MRTLLAFLMMSTASVALAAGGQTDAGAGTSAGMSQEVPPAPPGLYHSRHLAPRPAMPEPAEAPQPQPMTGPVDQGMPPVGYGQIPAPGAFPGYGGPGYSQGSGEASGQMGIGGGGLGGARSGAVPYGAPMEQPYWAPRRPGFAEPPFGAAQMPADAGGQPPQTDAPAMPMQPQGPQYGAMPQQPYWSASPPPLGEGDGQAPAPATEAAHPAPRQGGVAQPMQPQPQAGPWGWRPAAPYGYGYGYGAPGYFPPAYGYGRPPFAPPGYGYGPGVQGGGAQQSN